MPGTVPGGYPEYPDPRRGSFLTVVVKCWDCSRFTPSPPPRARVSSMAGVHYTRVAVYPCPGGVSACPNEGADSMPLQGDFNHSLAGAPMGLRCAEGSGGPVCRGCWGCQKRTERRSLACRVRSTHTRG